jgi:lantibiotic modifying enzyme
MTRSGTYLLALGAMTAATAPLTAGDAERRAALDAAKWVRSTAVRTDRGTAWPADPANPKTVSPTLYNGTAGVVLLFLEAHHATGDAAYLADARAGADYLLASIDHVPASGLYTGVAGIGFTLQEMHKATGDARYRDGAKKCIRLVTDRAKREGRGVEWDGGYDIIGGSAGIGLFLLYAARELDDPAALELAVKAGRRLVEVGRSAPSGLKWAPGPKGDRLMPNFSHGTAGVAYFLATLAVRTKEKEFREAAVAGAEYLKAAADTAGDGCLVFHHEPGGEKLFYLGWCHGPAGTARLFLRLHEATGDRAWLGWAERSAASVLASGIPGKRTEGFWDNQGACCGTAGVAEFFLGLHRATGDKRYLEFARTLTADLLARAERDEKGVRWVGAEFRVKPELRVAQTGYMQGAAGVGVWLLRLDAFDRGRAPRVALPDSPFP